MVNDRWFEDHDNTRKAVGLVEFEEVETDSNTCGICFDRLDEKELCGVACGHKYCHACWNGYLHAAIERGPHCLTLRCPEPGCSTYVPKSFVENKVHGEHLRRYESFWNRSLVEECPILKWCPGPNCKCAIQCTATSTETLDIICGCGHSFCWGCLEEAHRPVLCKTVRKWLAKNSAESENLVWILANSKPCPKCKRPIEKNQGCMHMTCSAPCCHEFCWLCLEPWRKHGEQTGGPYQCNRYIKAKEQGLYEEEEVTRRKAKCSLERYMHYFERWDAHDKARKRAKKDLVELNSKLDSLSSSFASTANQLKFFTDAYLQIIECRRILKWTYAYGYFHFMDSAEPTQQEFLEFLQGEAEMSLEKLHHIAETNVEHLVENPLEFNSFRSKLTGLTCVAKDYFDKLVIELEHGFHHLSSRYSESPGTSLGRSSSPKSASLGPSVIAKNSRKLEQLISMGFDVREAQAALEQGNGDMSEATTILLASLTVGDA